MKKLKFLSILCLPLAFCISACEQEQPKANHCQADLDAGFVSNELSHWHVCKDKNCSTHIDEQEHEFDEGTIIRDKDHYESGTLLKKCVVCGFEKAQKIDYIPCENHVFEQVNGEDKIVWTQQPSCTKKGMGEKTCINCGREVSVETDKLEHNYEKDANGNYIYEVDKEATHSEAGIRHRVCKHCGQIDSSTYNLNHDIVEIDSPIHFSEENPSGRSLNVCRTKDCNYCGLEFDLKDLTKASKQTLVFSEDGGAKFYGHSIGVFPLEAGETPLISPEDMNQFDKNQEGDFFEFVFDLTKYQASYLNNCMLYCTAKPANYLDGLDFWANDSNVETFGQGRYIDDLPEHVETINGKTQGKLIENYRYLLYVDDEVKDFNENIKVPVPNPDGISLTNRTHTDLPKGEFVMPYTFHLHEGTNKIKIVMAGGYKSLFYSFKLAPREGSNIIN